MTENMKKTTDQLVQEFLDISEMFRELNAQKKAFEKELKSLTKNGPIVLKDGRTVETVVTYKPYPDTNKMKECGLYDELSKIITVRTLKIK
ncbi:hypothetical protein AAK706_04470 [Erysipelotrichaceae bacterium 66-17]